LLSHRRDARTHARTTQIKGRGGSVHDIKGLVELVLDDNGELAAIAEVEEARRAVCA